MRVLLLRHGESEGNVDESVYTRKGDIDVELTRNGWQQAIGAGKFLSGLYTASGTVKWPVIYLSSYTRTKQTLSGALHGMKGTIPGEPQIFEDPRLIEKFFGAASALDHPPKGTSQEVIESLRKLSKSVYRNDPFSAKNLLGESTKETYVTIKNFIDGTFKRSRDEGNEDFLIVTHGALIQAFLMSWMHVQIPHKKQIGCPGNCDVIEISGSSKNWKIKRIYNGQEAIAVNDDFSERLKPFTITQLPPVPLELQ